ESSSARAITELTRCLPGTLQDLNVLKCAVGLYSTHAEAKNVADKIRSGLRDCGAIGAEDRVVQRLVNTGWTYAERRDATRYQAGQVIEFHRGSWSLPEDRERKVRFNRGEQWSVVEASENKVLIEHNGQSAWLGTGRANDFAVHDRE